MKNGYGRMKELEVIGAVSVDTASTADRTP